MKDELNILMLEDDPNDAALIQKILERAGFKFTTTIVSDKKAFIEALNAKPFDVLLADHHLPQFNSEEALEIFRKQNIHIPFILVTGTVSEEFAASSIQQGADDFILKSNLNRLPSSILKAIEKQKVLLAKEQAEKELHKSNNFYTMMMESLPSVAYSLELKENYIEVTYVSPNIKRLCGFDPEKFTGTINFWMAHIHPEDLQNGTLNPEVLRSKNELEREYRLKISDGTYRWFYDKARMVQQANGTYLFVGTWTDTTEKRRIEAAVNHERKLRDVVLRNSDVGVIATDARGNITVINEAGQKMFQLSHPKSSISEFQEQFELFAADGKTKLELNQLPLMRAIGREAVSNFEMIMVNKRDGRKTHLVTNAQPIYDENRKMTGAVSASHNITNLKLTEEKLKEKIHELDTFIYRTAHDLRGPLTSILGLVAVAKKELNDPTAQIFLDKFDKTAMKLDNILNDLASVTKITSDTTNFTKIHLDTLIPALVKRLNIQQDQEAIKFNMDIPERHQFLSDRYLLRSILHNILENSIQYRKADAQNTVIDISVKNVNDFVRIQISDNGQGIPDDIREKVFDMFYKGNYASTGTGLGLYITRVAVEKLGGTISVSSNYGRGTTISVYFPALDDRKIESLMNERVRAK